MDIQAFANSRFGASLGLFLGRNIPPAIGYNLTNFLSKYIANQKASPMVQAVKQNQWVIREENISPFELEQAVQRVFSHAGRCFVDLYRNQQNPAGIESLFTENEKTKEIAKLCNDENFGALVITAHLSNFDLALYSLGINGLSGQVLSISTPPGGYELQNKLRLNTGFEITPINHKSLRDSILRMRTGGFVYTGVDRPIDGKSNTLNFFRRPSHLPTGHIRLAKKAGVPIIVATARWDPGGNYHIDFSDPIPMQSFENMNEYIKVNGEAILHVIEQRIMNQPDQWLMYYPVWPNISVPG